MEILLKKYIQHIEYNNLIYALDDESINIISDSSVCKSVRAEGYKNIRIEDDRIVIYNFNTQAIFNTDLELIKIKIKIKYKH
jgi:hypothetical protein